MISWQDEYYKVTKREKGDENVSDDRPSPGPTIIVAPNGAAMWARLFPFTLEEVSPFFPDGDIMRHLAIDADKFVYLWPSYPGAKKIRPILVKDGRKHFWDPASTANPLFWPDPPLTLGEEIYFCEGESDTICARMLGLEAYALTKGASTPICEKVIKELADRGVRRINLLFDDDSTGRRVAQQVKQMIDRFSLTLEKESRIECRVLPIGEKTLPMYGEKDLRQIFLRVKDVEAMAEIILELKQMAEDEKVVVPWVSGVEFASKEVPQVKWLIRDILAPEAFSMITGFPKMGKSYLSLDMAVSLATGTPFLNHFDCTTRGDVLYIAKETTEWDLQHRFKMMARAKGLEASFWDADLKSQASHSSASTLASSEPDVHFLLRSEFRFDPGELLLLQNQILEFQQRSGRPLSLVVIDPFSYCMPSGGFDLNSYADFMSRVAVPSKEVINRTGTAFEIVFHQGKGDGFLALGSTAIEGAYTNKIYYVEKAREAGKPVKIGILHRDAPGFIFELEPGVLEDEYEPRVISDVEEDKFSVKIVKRGYADRQREVARQLLTLCPGNEFTWGQVLSQVNLTDLRDVTPSLLENAFGQLRQQGAVVAVRRGVYKTASNQNQDDNE